MSLTCLIFNRSEGLPLRDILSLPGSFQGAAQSRHWYQVPGTRYQVLGTRYQVRGTWDLDLERMRDCPVPLSLMSLCRGTRGHGYW